MKKIMLGLLALSLFGCGGAKVEEPQVVAKPTIETKINEYIASHADDPASYQPVKTEVADTIMEGEREIWKANNDLQNALSGIEWEKADNEKAKKDWVKFPDIANEEIKTNNERIKEYEADLPGLRSRLDSIKTSYANTNKLLGYIYRHQYRLKNKLGALVLSESWVKTDPDLNVLYLGDNPW
jgi:chromosome segregation ATPase